ncbi:MAG: EutN/CcmL family microcompartment protein [Candidatus Eisenbacteria bacterium]
MHLAKVIGTVWATQKVESLTGQRFLVIQPLTHEGKASGRAVVAVDTVSAAPGQLVYYVASREAAKALADTWNPADAAILGIVDEVHVPASESQD